jgi:8-oxo-dGTP diphosphatase
LGIEILAFEPWCVECVLYPHALVELHFCRVTQWAGELQMREGQEYSWQTLPLALSPVLPGAYPVLDLLSRG